MQMTLDYGKKGLAVDLPEDRVVRHLAYKSAEPLADPRAELDEVLARPSGTPPLAELARGRRDACIAICDITRPVPNEMILKPMLHTLQDSGIAQDDILILIATGLHRPNLGDELVEMVGRDIVDNYRIENHDGRALDEHAHLGDSPRGVPIWIDRRYVEADLKISTGLVEPHLMAGFSGGRKVIMPGLAALESIRPWHGPDFLEHPRADCGLIEGNPVHEENTWIARKVGCDFIVNAVIDTERRPLKFVAGDMEAALYEAIEFVRGVVTATVPHEVDIVVTSSAGYPLDTTFYQAVKGLCGARPVVKQGGTIIMAAGLADGVGSDDFQRLIDESPSLEVFIERITGPDYFVPDQWQLEELAKVCRKAKVKLVTDGMGPEAVNRLFVESAPSVEAALAASMDEYGQEAEIAVIPKGPYVLAQVENGNGPRG